MLAVPGPGTTKKPEPRSGLLATFYIENKLNLHLMRRRRFTPVSYTRSDYCVFASLTLPPYQKPHFRHVTSCGDNVPVRLAATGLRLYDCSLVQSSNLNRTGGGPAHGGGGDGRLATLRSPLYPRWKRRNPRIQHNEEINT
jgi:hypothetical protein